MVADDLKELSPRERGELRPSNPPRVGFARTYRDTARKRTGSISALRVRNGPPEKRATGAAARRPAHSRQFEGIDGKTRAPVSRCAPRAVYSEASSFACCFR